MAAKPTASSTVLVHQCLVQPHSLELIAVEEEGILNNKHALTANGFAVELDISRDAPVGRRPSPTSLPIAEGHTFIPTDLQELLALLLESPPLSSLSPSKHVRRPSKVCKLLASRGCRSSVMVSRTLEKTQMESIVRHMGNMDKPWSCPHGRPTMRHLFGLDKWEGWLEGEGVSGPSESMRRRFDSGGMVKKEEKEKG